MTHTSGHPVDPERIRSSGGIIYHRMAIEKKGTCQGFTFNPTLKRMSEPAFLGLFLNREPPSTDTLNYR